MGEDALEFLNGIGFPLSPAIEAKLGELQRFTPDDRGARRPRHRLCPRRGTCEDRVLERLQDRRPLVGRTAALLGAPRSSRLAAVVYYETSTHLWHAGALVGRRVDRVRPDAGGVRRSCCSRCRCATPAGCCPVGLAFAVLAAVLTFAGRRRLRELRAARRGDAPRLVVPRLLRDARLGRARRLRSSRGSTRTRSGAGRRSRSSSTTSTSSPCSRSRSPCPASTPRRTSASPTCSSSRSSSARRRASGCASFATWLALRRRRSAGRSR